jgi:hypothetical protein
MRRATGDTRMRPVTDDSATWLWSVSTTGTTGASAGSTATSGAAGVAGSSVGWCFVGWCSVGRFGVLHRRRSGHGCFGLGQQRRDVLIRFPDDPDDRSDRHRGPRFDHDLPYDPTLQGLDIHIGLVGLDLRQDIAGLDAIAFLHLPLEQPALFHGRAELRHYDFGCHAFPALQGVLVDRVSRGSRRV